MTANRSINVIVAALGGEGGGVLSDWLITAARREGLQAQSTSIPGVAQRTGATTYYIELFPVASEVAPVLALTPTPGDIDVVIASELVEAGRAMEKGFVVPDRTTLIASTNRVYSIGEKSAMSDGRFDADRIHRAADALAKQAILFDMSRTAQSSGGPLNAVLFGALIASGSLPLGRDSAESAIRDAGKSVESNLKGFAAGFEQALAEPRKDVGSSADPTSTAWAHRSIAREPAYWASIPADVKEIILLGIERLVRYQGRRYAQSYLDRLVPIHQIDKRSGRPDFPLMSHTGRLLAVWMSYEDVIRVADLKTRFARRARIRKEVRAGNAEIVRVVDFLKPGLDELCSLLPPSMGRAILAFAERNGLINRFNKGLYISTTKVTGFLLLRLLAALRPWRPYTLRYQTEQSQIARWLSAIESAGRHDLEFAVEIAACAQLVKGYGETHRRGSRNFERLADIFFNRNLATDDAKALSASLNKARSAALADPEGVNLLKTLKEAGFARI